MIYAKIVQTQEQGEIGHNLDIISHTNTDKATGTDSQLSLHAEGEIRQYFELDDDALLRENEIMWWLSKNNFVWLGGWNFQCSEDNFTM